LMGSCHSCLLNNYNPTGGKIGMKKLLMLLLAFVIVVPAYAAKLEPETNVLITKAENDAYKKLSNDDERKKFEKEFWEKRDPTPTTPENEYREEIKQRIKDVAKAMRRNDAWETDMGKTLVLLGPPAKTTAGAEKPNEAEATWYPEAEEGGRSVDTGTSATQGEAKRVFLYQSLPAGVASGETKVEFLQVRNRWSFRETNKSQELLEKARANELTRLTQIRASGQSATPQAPTTTAAPAAVAPAAPAVVPVTPEIKSALDATGGGTAPTAVSFLSKADMFQTSTGELFATVAVNTSAAGPTTKTGLRVVDSTGKVVHETEVPFATTGEVAGYFQTKVPLPAAGDYTVALVVANGTEVGGSKHTLSVPDATKFNASSIILSKKFTQLPEAKPEKEPYTFGKIKVYPNLEGAFAKADDLIVVYEVYNPQIDAATGKPNLEAVYNFEREGKSKKTPPAPPNGLVTGNKMTISTSYPLQTFAAGKYKLTVEVTDKATGQKAVREAAFEVQ
jgi:GWxTD domain-containing protein